MMRNCSLADQIIMIKNFWIFWIYTVSNLLLITKQETTDYLYVLFHQTVKSCIRFSLLHFRFLRYRGIGCKPESHMNVAGCGLKLNQVAINQCRLSLSWIFDSSERETSSVFLQNKQYCYQQNTLLYYYTTFCQFLSQPSRDVSLVHLANTRDLRIQ